MNQIIPCMGVIGGGITFATFKPCCDKLKNVLQDTYLSNPQYIEQPEDIIDIESGIGIIADDIENNLKEI